jgi:hypothetical protein
MTVPTVEEMNEEIAELLKEISEEEHETAKCPSCDEPALLIGPSGEVCDSCGYHCRR